MYSIYHFFAHLYRNRSKLADVSKLEAFQWDRELFSYEGDGRFPDYAICINPNGSPSGGELIELKDSQSYTVASFNSTIPTGIKSIEELTKGKSNNIRDQMKAAGDDIKSLPWREVYYLVRGKHKKTKCTKICLVHGSFFETVKVEKLIREAFGQVLEERLREEELELSPKLHQLLLRIFSRQESFSRVRQVDDASVSLRFRVMTQARKEGNILSSRSYPKIKDDTINLVIPRHSDDDIVERLKHLRQALSSSEIEQGDAFTIKHPFNGYFFVKSFPIKSSQKGTP